VADLAHARKQVADEVGFITGAYIPEYLYVCFLDCLAQKYCFTLPVSLFRYWDVLETVRKLYLVALVCSFVSFIYLSAVTHVLFFSTGDVFLRRQHVAIVIERLSFCRSADTSRPCVAL
jgi:hypothetical protein